MKNFFCLLSIVSGLFILSGCPYESKVPLGKPVEKINPAMFGIWNEEHWEFNIGRQDEFTYNCVFRNRYKNEISDTNFAYSTTINGITFLNVWEKGSSEKYGLYKLEMNGNNQFKVFPVTADIEKEFSSGDSLKAFIAGEMKREGFYEGPMIFSRAR